MQRPAQQLIFIYLFIFFFSSLDHDLLSLDIGGLLDRSLPDDNLPAGLLDLDLLADPDELLGLDPLGEPLSIGCLANDLLAELLDGVPPGDDLLDASPDRRSPDNDLPGRLAGTDLLGIDLLDELLDCRPLDSDLLGRATF